MEHASVAAFARFTLELLSLGAPAELVAASQRALADEIRHAKLCFGLATAYAGHALGPGPLSSEGALGAQSLDAIVETAIAEACIGETLAAVEAAEAAAHATDPSVRRVLLAIARDEKRHAELGWRFLSWVLDVAPASARPALRARLCEIVEDARRRMRAETYRDERSRPSATRSRRPRCRAPACRTDRRSRRARRAPRSRARRADARTSRLSSPGRRALRAR